MMYDLCSDLLSVLYFKGCVFSGESRAPLPPQPDPVLQRLLGRGQPPSQVWVLSQVASGESGAPPPLHTEAEEAHHTGGLQGPADTLHQQHT